MTDDTLFTHQLKRAADECKPFLLYWYPGLRDATELVQRTCDSGGDVESLIARLEARFGTGLVVRKLSDAQHERRDPYDELVEMRGSEEGICSIQIDG